MSSFRDFLQGQRCQKMAILPLPEGRVFWFRCGDWGHAEGTSHTPNCGDLCRWRDLMSENEFEALKEQYGEADF